MAFDEQGLRSLGRTIEGASKRRPGRRLRRVLLFVALFAVLLAGAGAGYAWYLNDQVHRIDVAGLSSSAGGGAEAGSENILMVGSTSRCALKVQNPAYGLCSQGVTGVNSDVIMILHVNEAKQTLSILSIPRDLFVPNVDKGSPGKVDGALAAGPSELVRVIQNDFNIPIQHYVELNFDTFANVVNALGGLDMYFPMPVYDAYSGLYEPVAGCHHLDGVQALQVVRARHLQYKGPGVTSTNPQNWPQEAQSDLARIRRDHEFLRVLATAVAKRGLSDPITDERLVSAVASQLTVDSGFSASHMVGLVLAFHGVNPNAAPQYTLPVSVSTSESYIYGGNNYGNIEFPVQPLDQQVIDKFLGLPTENTGVSGGQLPSPGSVTVSVLNGSGAYNQATDTGSALQSLGFKLVGVGDTTVNAQQSETLVTYAKAADEPAAQAVANSLSGAVILTKGSTSNGAQVTVVTGSDFSVNQPAAAPTSGSSGSSSGQSSSTSAGSTGTGSTGGGSSSASNASSTAQGFEPASPAIEQLQPWDPRACPGQ